MKTQTNVYLCVTEYHILLSIWISTEVFFKEKFKNIIILCNGGRFKDINIYNLESVGNIEYRKFDEAEFLTREFMDRVGNECTNTLFLFNLNYPHFLFIAESLRRSKVETALVQDGLGLYMYLPFTVRERIGNLQRSFHYIKKLGLMDIRFLIKCFGFEGRWGKVFNSYDVLAMSSLISQIWLTIPEGASYAKEKVCPIPKFGQNALNYARCFFRYKDNENLMFKKNDFLFVDQRIDGTADFISELSRKYLESTIYVKLHPRSPESWANDFNKLPNVKMIDSMKGIPLELLIQTLSKVVVITAYSAALLMDNPSCKFYYTYPWFAKKGYGKGEFEEKSIVNPTNHIQVIDSLEEVELY